jgi:hypothetical protein
MGPDPGIDTTQNFLKKKKSTYSNKFTEDFKSKFQMVEHYGINPNMLTMKFEDDEGENYPHIESDSPLYKRVNIPKTPADLEPDEMIKFHENVSQLQNL